MQDNKISAEIITIGTEITTGNTLNTNAHYLSKKIFDLGIDCYYQTTVDDDPLRLANVIKIALSRSDLIITTGGLGPTIDDMTKEVFAKVLGQELILDNGMENNIRDYFKSNNKIMSENNLRQAHKFRNSIFLRNSIGTAPGILIEIHNKKIFLLPGPPRELSLMFNNHVKPLLNMGGIRLSKSINIIGIGESILETELLKMDLATDNTSITTFAKDNSVEIRVISKGFDTNHLKKEFNEILEKINQNFSNQIYGYDNISLEEILIQLLKENKYTIAISESCTGGLISSKLTSIPGASIVFDRGLITYSNESKIEELKVDIETLNKHGAVSKEIAYEMAVGLLSKTKVDIAVSITGIAGPDGGSANKPVGLVYICIISQDKYKILEEHFKGDRKTIQRKSSIVAMNEIRKFILK